MPLSLIAADFIFRHDALLFSLSFAIDFDATFFATIFRRRFIFSY